MKLEARPAARSLAKNVQGMPYKEAVFLIETALDHIDYVLYVTERDSDFDPGGNTATAEFEAWKNGLDKNSRVIVEAIELSVLTNMIRRARAQRIEDARQTLMEEGHEL